MADESIKAPEPAATAPAQPSAPAAAVAAPQDVAPVPAQTSPVAAPAEPTVAATPSLLESIAPPADVKLGDKPTEPVKPVDATKPTDAKPADEKPADAAAQPTVAEAPAPIEWKYELPSTITMDETQTGEFRAALEKFRTDPNEAAKEVLGLGAKMMETFAKDYAEQTLRNQQKTFLETRKKWATDWAADLEIGGSGHQTALAAIARVRDYGVPAKDRAAFDQFLRVTGAGDHPAFGRMMHNLARYVDEPQAIEAPTEIKPPHDGSGQHPGRKGGRILYDNPRSANDRG
jgi:hypothetical protein